MTIMAMKTLKTECFGQIWSNLAKFGQIWGHNWGCNASKLFMGIAVSIKKSTAASTTLLHCLKPYVKLFWDHNIANTMSVNSVPSVRAATPILHEYLKNKLKRANHGYMAIVQNESIIYNKGFLYLTIFMTNHICNHN